MSDASWVLLPGLDGSGCLFQWFLPYLSSQASIVRYPAEPGWQIEDYAQYALAAIPPSQRCIVIAESFSSPIALRLLRQRPDIAGLVLVASFIRCPHPLLKYAPTRALGYLRRLLRSRALLRALCLGWSASGEKIDALQTVIDAISTPVLEARLTLLRELDAADDLHAAAVPVLFLNAARDRLVMARIEPPDRGECMRAVSIDAPHFLLQACPAAAWQAIESWQRGLNA
ncbi:MAG: alpha/beta hydrolase [Dokdonella sp.]